MAEEYESKQAGRGRVGEIYRMGLLKEKERVHISNKKRKEKTNQIKSKRKKHARNLPLLKPMQTRMTLHPLNAMVRIQILMHHHLKKTTPSLPRNNDAPREEEHPDPKQLPPVLGDDQLLVCQPVLVPPEDGGGVVHPEDVGGFEFETGAFETADYPVYGAGGVGAGEDVFVHEETPVDGCGMSVSECVRERGG